MPAHRPHATAARLATRSQELALAVPQVVGHRVARMMLAGPVLSSRDHKEFSGMVAEKQVAFFQSWLAMWAHAFQAQQRLMGALMQTGLPGAGVTPAAHWWQATTAWQRASLGVLDKGLAPLHRKATANARRLGRTRLR
ncbi:MAG: polyhydroxyalkanoate granule-associated phasin [Aquabacterium sp.]